MTRKEFRKKYLSETVKFISNSTNHKQVQVILFNFGFRWGYDGEGGKAFRKFSDQTGGITWVFIEMGKDYKGSDFIIMRQTNYITKAPAGCEVVKADKLLKDFENLTIEIPKKEYVNPDQKSLF